MTLWMMALILLLLGAVIRRVFNPEFTAAAVEAYMAHSLTTRQYEDFATDYSEVWVCEGRKTFAHWISHSSAGYPGSYIIEFDVHPSTWILSISASRYLFLRNREHFDQLQSALLAGDFSQDFTTEEERTNLQREIEAM